MKLGVYGVYRDTTIRTTGGNSDGEYNCIERDCVIIHDDTG